IAQVCLEKNIHIPEEITLIGVNNDEQVCELATPPLSSVALNDKITGFQMAEILDQLMAGNAIPRVNVLTQPSHIVERQSTDIIAVQDSDVANAVRFIRTQLRKNIGVADVTRATAVPRRTLERKFKKNLQKTIHQAITHERIKLAEQFLVTTRMSITQIATQVGYLNNGELIRNFKKVKKTTPLAHRKHYSSI
ncbi:MAG: helix-turn-helix domain-containing protein, partial [Sedimentisphaerales bacterium]|nr:helix-turn-helix domain-containing protein [Sedimentisphaerales bacterium]